MWCEPSGIVVRLLVSCFFYAHTGMSKRWSQQLKLLWCLFSCWDCSERTNGCLMCWRLSHTLRLASFFTMTMLCWLLHSHHWSCTLRYVVLTSQAVFVDGHLGIDLLSRIFAGHMYPTTDDINNCGAASSTSKRFFYLCWDERSVPALNRKVTFSCPCCNELNVDMVELSETLKWWIFASDSSPGIYWQLAPCLHHSCRHWRPLSVLRFSCGLYYQSCAFVYCNVDRLAQVNQNIGMHGARVGHGSGVVSMVAATMRSGCWSHTHDICSWHT